MTHRFPSARRRPLGPGALFFSLLLWAAAALSTPLVPASDDQVIEVLPGGIGRAEERRLRRELAQQPRDPQRAAELSRRYIEQARALGDPRLAGQALAAVQRWTDPATTPPEVLLMQATVRQYLHDFDGAAHLLEGLVRRDPKQPQAWLTLATLRRLKGQYGPSDEACRAVAAAGGAMYAVACHAENRALRGETDAARADLQRLLDNRALDRGNRNWLLTTLGELEERAGQPAAAETAYKAALAAQDDAYTATDYADFLIAQGRDAEVPAVLASHPRTDTALLRLAIAGQRAGSSSAPRDVEEMRQRFAQANERPEARFTHARELALFALWVDQQPAHALTLARINVRQQREPIDLLIYAQAARGANDAAGLREVRKLAKDMGLHDPRIDALL